MDWLLAIVPTCVLALVTFTSSPGEAPKQWCVGRVESVTADGVVIVPEVCRDHSRVPLGVRFDGRLPGGVCGGSDVYIVGRDKGDHFEATSIQPFNNGRYDGGCWRFRCMHEALRPARCVANKFQ